MSYFIVFDFYRPHAVFKFISKMHVIPLYHYTLLVLFITLKVSMPLFSVPMHIIFEYSEDANTSVLFCELVVKLSARNYYIIQNKRANQTHKTLL
jgi:hypothetical protein